MTLGVDADLLDDVEAVEAADRTGLLREVAAAPARLREAAFLAEESVLGELADEGRPRALVVAGSDEAGDAAELLAAAATAGAPTPVVAHRAATLPAWVGAADLVVVVGGVGTDATTGRLADEAARRGARVVTVGPVGGVLAEHGGAARAPHVAVPPWRPGTAVWSLLAPLLVVARHAGVLPALPVDAVAARLDDVSERCRASKDSFLNPAKTLAQQLVGRTAAFVAESPVAGAASGRAARQLARLAGVPAASGTLPEFAEAVRGLLRATGATDRLCVVALRDGDPDVDARPDPAEDPLALVVATAREHDVRCHELTTEGYHVLERLACLVGTTDFATVYVSLLAGGDPGIPPADDRGAE